MDLELIQSNQDYPKPWKLVMRYNKKTWLTILLYAWKYPNGSWPEKSYYDKKTNTLYVLNLDDLYPLLSEHQPQIETYTGISILPSALQSWLAKDSPVICV